MRKFVFLFVAAIGGIAIVKGGLGSFGDHHVRGAGLSFPGLGSLPNVATLGGQATAMLSQAASLLNGPLGQATGQAAGQSTGQAVGRPVANAIPGSANLAGIGPQTMTAARAPAPKPPAMPQVTSVNGTYVTPGANTGAPNTGAPNTGAPNTGAPNTGALNAASRTSDQATPPGLARPLSGQANTGQTGAPNPDQAQTRMLQQLLADAKANPAAYKAQLEAVAKALRGSQ